MDEFDEVSALIASIDDERSPKPLVQVDKFESPEPISYIKPHEELEKHEKVAEEILKDWRADKEKIDVFVEHLIDIIEGNGDAGKPGKMHYEALAKIFEVKSKSAETAIKVYEVRAKLLAAIKPGAAQLKAINVNIGNDSGDLSDLLAQNVDMP